MESETKESSECLNDKPEAKPSENQKLIERPEAKPSESQKLITLANPKLSENTLVNGSVNGEIKPPTTKCMNILQNIIIKKEEHDHCIQIPIKREIDEDTLNNRIKIPRRDTAEHPIGSTPIKEEILDIKSEITETTSNTAECEVPPESKTEVHTCFRCNMIFMEKKAFTIHSKHCGKTESNYTPDEAPSSSCNVSSNNRCSGKANNYLMHLEQLPRLIESIRNTPCLYNTDIEGYNNLELKEQMWARIAADCNFINAKIAKATWKKIVQEYCESLTKRQTNTLTEPYRYEQQMRFMLPFINMKPRNDIQHCNSGYTNDYSSHANFTSVTIPNEIIDDDEDGQSIVHINTPPKRQRISTPYIVRQVEREPPPPLNPTNFERGIDFFYMSMSESTKHLPVHLQLQVKKKIFEAVLEAEEIVNRVNPIRREPYSPPPTPDDEHFQY